MKDSVIYQEILEEGMEKGRIGEARSMLVRLGSKRLGIPDAPTQSRLELIDNPRMLEELTERLVDGAIASWGQLLGSSE